jgi:stage II sporulation protein D
MPRSNRWSMKSAWKRWRPSSHALGKLLGWASLALVVVLLGALVIPGCPPPRSDSLAPFTTPTVEAPLRTEGVPIIRVLIGSGESIRLATTGPYRIKTDSSVVATSLAPLGECHISRRGLNWEIQQASYLAQRITIEAMDKSCVRVGSTSYRGCVVFEGDGSMKTILAVNHLDLETYLAGVLPREMFPQWSFTAYQAQAIVARTYALYERATSGKGKPFDVHDDQSSQVYGGFSGESEKAWQAVRDTHGVVLATGASGHERIFKTYFSSCCGGLTNNAYILNGGKLTEGPLVGGQECLDCQNATRYRWPMVTVSKEAVYRCLAKTYPAVAALSRITGVEVTESIGERPVWINVIGPLPTQKVRLRAEDLRLCLIREEPAAKDLFSMNCKIVDAGANVMFVNGKGHGHGVGMCQWGAEGMAQRGSSAERIVAFYYPGARLFRAY